MFAKRNNALIAAGLLAAVFLWGGNNTGVRFLVQTWPPILVGSTRFLCAGMLMFALLRWTNWLGKCEPTPPEIRSKLWWRGGLSLAAYIAIFNTALRYTSASHVALYLAASPVWALLWEGWGGQERRELLRRYGAALLAFTGVLVLLLPVLKLNNGSVRGELFGLTASVLWTSYGRQARLLGQKIGGVAVSAHTMWRAGFLLLPLVFVEISGRSITWNLRLLEVQLFCIVGGGVAAFIFWNNGLRHWKTSEVFLFNNLIPLSTMLWAHSFLGERITRSFWLAMILIIAGVLIGQAKWEKLPGCNYFPME